MGVLPDPAIMMAIKDLALAAKTTVDGFMAGSNKSTIKGPGLEFSQYRSYQPGDDLRWLDWKMYARSDRYYIRESEIETSIAVRFLLDASASMDHHDGGFTKMDYARYLAASLACLADMQGDAIGLNVFTNGDVYSLLSAQGRQHLARVYYQLENIYPAGSFTTPVSYKEIFPGAQKKELLVFITDMYERQGEIFKLLDALAPLKHEIIVFHLMGANELELDYKGYTRLEDLETGATVRVQGNQAAQQYRQRLTEHLTALRTQLLNRNIVYRMMPMNEPLGHALRDFLKQRNAIKK